jgi:tRNA G18 (ribose-2'-O)-methylase SpoU
MNAGFSVPQPISITNPDDARLAPYRTLSDPALADREGLFVAEGRMVVERLLRHPSLRAHSVLVTPPALDALGPVLAAWADEASRTPTPHDALPVFVVTPQIMETVAGFDVHRGALALGHRPAPRDWRALAANARRLVALERVGNADNVGGIFRAAAALGADGVLLGPACADPLYRKAIRTSMAATMVVPYATAEPWPGALGTLAAGGWTTVAMTPNAEAEPLDCVARATAGARHVLVVGHEGEGLLADTMHACTRRARIPMARQPDDLVDSLNVTTAAAIALYAFATAGATAGAERA